MKEVSVVSLVFAIAICALIAWLVTQHGMAKMRTAREKSRARDYYQDGSFELIEHSDRLVDSKTETKPKDNGNQKGGEAHAT